MLRTPFALAALLLAAAPALAQIPHADALDHLPTTSAADAPSEGIHVNGVWMLTVRNADGSVASRDTVHNALVNSGRNLLTGLLTGQDSDPQWGVRLWTPLPTEGDHEYASLIEATLTDESIFDENASYSPFVNTGTPAPTTVQLARSALDARPVVSGIASLLQLSGEVTWPEAVTISGVESAIFPFSSFFQARRVSAFTFKELAAPISVAAGQTIEVRVEISFD